MSESTQGSESTDISQDGLRLGADGQLRCGWYGGLPDYLHYHDTEWGVPVDSDQRLFEKISLEGFQSGLSWLTILRKRENFRLAFDQFDFYKITKYDAQDIERLVGDAGIVRHRGKIISTINNANRAIELIDEKGSLAAYFWAFEPQADERPARVNYATLRANPITVTSTLISKDLKKRGWSFVGPTTIYAFMQAMGMVNDHLEGCYCREKIENQRKTFTRP